MQVKSPLKVAALMLAAWISLTSCGKNDEPATGGAAVTPSQEIKGAAAARDGDVRTAPTTVDLSARTNESEVDGLNRLVGISYRVPQGDVHISYGYDGKFANYNIADTAVASLNGQKIAEAKTISIQRSPGEDTQVHETHFARDGTVTYNGMLNFRDTGCVRLIAEHPLAGTRRYRIFSQWPLEAGAMMPCPF